MEQKIQKLFEYRAFVDKKVWIINGKNIENLKNIITIWEGVGTQIYI